MHRPCTILLIVLVTLASPIASEASEAVSKQFEWQAENDTDTKTIKFGELTVRLSRHAKQTDAEGAAHARIEISTPGTRKGVFDADNAWETGSVQFAELDTKNRFPEVLFTTFSGGAHCCFGTTVLTFNGKKWVRVPEARVADGAGPRVQDIDNDGRAEVTEPDGAFLYAFSSYAYSNPPVRIYHLSGIKWIDVTRAPRFRSLHATEPKLVDEQCNPEKSSNGFWAGYVASEILIGEGRSAWRRMLGCYDRAASWGLCKPHESQSFEPQPTDFGPPPPGMKCDVSFRSFPNALDAFLRSSDYGPAVSKREIARFTKSERAKWAVVDADRRKVEADRERLQAERTKRILANQKAEWARERAERERSKADDELRRRASEARSRIREPLWQQIANCWTLPDVGRDRILPRVQVRLFLSDKGTLIAPPQVIRPSSEPLDQAQKLAVQAVLHAVNACAPYKVEAAEVNHGHGIDLAF